MFIMLNFEDSSLRGSYAMSPRKYKENTSHTAQQGKKTLQNMYRLRSAGLRRFLAHLKNKFWCPT
jgi:hypothetical protein